MNDIGFNDWRKIIEDPSAASPWITLYEYYKGDSEDRWIHAAIIPLIKKENCLKKASWDIGLDGGLPGFCEWIHENRIEYLRYGNTEGIEPLVFYRDFYDVKPSNIDISQEFIHYFSLWHNQELNIFVKIHDDGFEEEVIRVKQELVQFNLKYIKEYISVKKGLLALFYHIRRASDKDLEELGLADEDNDYSGDLHRYSISISNKPIFFYRNLKMNSSSQLMGKRLIPPLDDFKPAVWNEIENKVYEEFIVGVNNEGKSQLYSCNSWNLEPNKFLIPIFFSKQVLQKYYNNPQLYTVGDNFLKCANLWHLPIDNNHQKYVIVFLGDLGSLSNREQVYWKSFNVAPDGSMSQTTIKRSLCAEFASAQKSDLIFKFEFKQFSIKWKKKYGWELFRTLTSGDIHYFNILRIPLSNNAIEFEQQVLAIHKIIVEMINDKAIKNSSISPMDNLNGINKLKIFLEEKKFPEFETFIQFLKDLHNLRSSIAHSKGKKYQKIAIKFRIGEAPYDQVFDDILVKINEFLSLLTKHFL